MIANRVTTFLRSRAIVMSRYFAHFSPVKSPQKKNLPNFDLKLSIYPSRVLPFVASPLMFKVLAVGSAKVEPKKAKKDKSMKAMLRGKIFI